MKTLVLIGLLLIWMPADSRAQQRRALISRAQTLEAERRLSELGYWTGPVDGRLDEGTTSRLIAFQKWEGRAVTGKLTLEELEELRDAVLPTARDLGFAA